MASARARGRKGGRPHKMTPAKLRLALYVRSWPFQNKLYIDTFHPLATYEKTVKNYYILTHRYLVKAVKNVPAKINDIIDLYLYTYCVGSNDSASLLAAVPYIVLFTEDTFGLFVKTKA